MCHFAWSQFSVPSAGQESAGRCRIVAIAGSAVCPFARCARADRGAWGGPATGGGGGAKGDRRGPFHWVSRPLPRGAPTLTGARRSATRLAVVCVVLPHRC